MMNRQSLVLWIPAAFFLCAGTALRYFGFQISFVPNLSGMILFVPALACAMYLAWSIEPSRKGISIALSFFLATFVGWEVILLWRCWYPIAIVSNFWHWVLAFGSCVLSAKYIQWSSGFALVRSHKKGDGASVATKRLSVMKLLALLMICGLLLAIYQKLSLPYRVQQRPTAKWNELFPAHQYVYVSALIGGVMYSFLWAAVGITHRLGSLGLIALCDWIPIFGTMRWSANQLYFDFDDLAVLFQFDSKSVLPFGAADIWQESPYATLMKTPTGDWEPRSSLTTNFVEAFVQTLLTLCVLIWLKAAGYKLIIPFAQPRETQEGIRARAPCPTLPR